MKVAYLILAHNDIKHLNELTNQLKNEDCDIYIHVDKKSNINKELINNAMVISTQKINWGGFSLVQATLDLIRVCIDSKINYDYYILISGDSYPIVNNEIIQEYLKNNEGFNFLNIEKLPSKTKGMERITKYYIEDGNHRNKSIISILKRVVNKILRILPYNRNYKRELKIENFYAGNQWWAIHRDTMNYIHEFCRNNIYFLKYYKNTFIPDEVFFHTIIMNSKYNKLIKESIMYDDWNLGEPPYPSILGEEHLEDLLLNMKKGKMFARKVNSKNIDIIKNFLNK